MILSIKLSNFYFFPVFRLDPDCLFLWELLSSEAKDLWRLAFQCQLWRAADFTSPAERLGPNPAWVFVLLQTNVTQCGSQDNSMHAKPQ